MLLVFWPTPIYKTNLLSGFVTLSELSLYFKSNSRFLLSSCWIHDRIPLSICMSCSRLLTLVDEHCNPSPPIPRFFFKLWAMKYDPWKDLLVSLSLFLIQDMIIVVVLLVDKEKKIFFFLCLRKFFNFLKVVLDFY